MKTRGGHNKRPVVWNGKEYKSLAEMAEKTNTAKSLIRYYLREDRPFKGHFIDYKIQEYERV